MITMPVASRIVVVWDAAQHRPSSGSSAGSCGPIGDGGTCGSGSTMCSPAHNESKPASSASAAVVASISGRLLGPMLMWNSPSFIPQYAHGEIDVTRLDS